MDFGLLVNGDEVLSVVFGKLRKGLWDIGLDYAPMGSRHSWAASLLRWHVSFEVPMGHHEYRPGDDWMFSACYMRWDYNIPQRHGVMLAFRRWHKEWKWGVNPKYAPVPAPGSLIIDEEWPRAD